MLRICNHYPKSLKINGKKYYRRNVNSFREKELNQGAFGNVVPYLDDDGNKFLIKFNKTESKTSAGSFSYEANLFNQYKPNHIKPFKAFKLKKRRETFECLLMEDLGESLYELILGLLENSSSNNIRKIWMLFLNSGIEIQRMHERNIVHNDLKLENIVGRKDSENVTIIDFGLAAKTTDGKSQPEIPQNHHFSQRNGIHFDYDTVRYLNSTIKFFDILKRIL